jgi:SAM-dependent methyltransferase
MNSVRDHYAKHLGPVYIWMLGDLESAAARAAAELDGLGLNGSLRGLAADLGAGAGLHALALAQRGYRVVALDTCRELLNALEARARSLSDTAPPLRTVESDLVTFRSCAEGPFEALLCMGDTLTHLTDRTAVESLLASVAASLAPGGTFAATFRDYSRPLEGDSRFIPVRADESRILTCFLEYGRDTVTVHDLLYEKRAGEWRLTVSSYPKLILAPEWVVERLSASGLEVRRERAPGGMVRIVAQRR